MLDINGVFKMETRLLKEISEEFFDIDCPDHEDDTALYKAFCAIQELRCHMEKKEKEEVRNVDRGSMHVSIVTTYIRKSACGTMVISTTPVVRKENSYGR